MPTTFAFNSFRAAAERQQALAEAQGYFAESYHRGAAGASTAMVSGTVYFSSVGLATGDRVSNVVVPCVTVGATFSGVGFKAGIYTKAGALVASTGDVSASFLATGAKVLPLAVQSNGDAYYTVPASDGYYIALLAIAVTGPALMRTASGGANHAFFTGGSLNEFGAQTGQTDLPTSATMSAVANVIGYWAGVS